MSCMPPTRRHVSLPPSFQESPQNLSRRVPEDCRDSIPVGTLNSAKPLPPALRRNDPQRSAGQRHHDCGCYEAALN